MLISLRQPRGRLYVSRTASVPYNGPALIHERTVATPGPRPAVYFCPDLRVQIEPLTTCTRKSRVTPLLPRMSTRLETRADTRRSPRHAARTRRDGRCHYQMLISDDVRRVESETRAPTLLHSIHSTLHHVCRGSPMCAMIWAFPQHPVVSSKLPVSKSNRLKSAAGFRGARPRRARAARRRARGRPSAMPVAHCKLQNIVTYSK